MMSEDKTPMVSAILLAAGKPESVEQNILLLPFGRGTVLQRTLDNLLASQVGEVIVVLGSDAGKINETIGQRKVTVTHNHEYENGVSTSIITGLGKLHRFSRLVMLAFGDQPLIYPQTYNELIESALNTEKGITIPSYYGRPGNPIIISLRYRAELNALTGDEDGRRLLKAHSQEVKEVPVDSEGVIIRINTKDEYEKRLKNL